jgi:hypothetical protein
MDFYLYLVGCSRCDLVLLVKFSHWGRFRLFAFADINLDIFERVITMKEHLTPPIPSQSHSDTSALSESQSKTKQFSLSLPQPLLVLGTMFFVASAYIYQWFDAEIFTVIMIILLLLLPLPLILIAERIWTKRQDWILTPKEFAEITIS